jgi:hypothetical protein
MLNSIKNYCQAFEMGQQYERLPDNVDYVGGPPFSPVRCRTWIAHEAAQRAHRVFPGVLLKTTSPWV